MRFSVFEQNFVPFKFYPRGITFEPELHESPVWITRALLKLGSALVSAEESKESDEAYSIDLESTGYATLHANTICGGLHALTTFSQLFYAHSKAPGQAYTPFAPVRIRDRPAFSHRGLSLDIARNRISPRKVIQILDAMSLSRMNRLHLHAWDSQSWPIEIPALPELAAKGAYDQAQLWTVADLEEVQRYGTRCGIQVYLEADMPGHTASIHHAYPELVVAYNLQPWSKWCLEAPSGQLKLNDPRVYEFLDKLFGDLLPRVSKYSSLLQIGGEEINKNIYELDETIGSSSEAVLKPLLERFMLYVIAQARKYELQPIAWEEAVLEWDLDIPKDTIIQAWKSESSVAQIVAKGYRALAGSYTHWYLDGGMGGWLDPDPGNQDSPVKDPYPDWIGSYKNWRQVLSYDPLQGVPAEHHRLVLGGGIFLWCELVDEANIDVLLWPRVCAAAEVLWRGKGEICEDSTRRLAIMRERLVAQGFGAQMVQMEWCLQNPGSGTL